jgi:hypothetical protein
MIDPGDLSEFFRSDEYTFLDFGRIAEVGIGTVIGAFFSGATALILALFDIPINLLAGLAGFGGEVVNIVVGIPAVLVDRGFVASVPFVLEAGPAGFVAALAVVLPPLFVLSWVVSRVRE